MANTFKRMEKKTTLPTERVEELKARIAPYMNDDPFNVDGKPYTSPQEIKANLIAQLTAPVRWTKTIQQMIADGAEKFTEYGPGNVQQGLIKKIKAAKKTQKTDSQCQK